jgi:hypothetical protein
LLALTPDRAVFFYPTTYISILVHFDGLKQLARSLNSGLELSNRIGIRIQMTALLINLRHLIGWILTQTGFKQA